MKYSFFLLILIFSFTKAFSKIADGYIVTLNSDTVFVKIKVPGAFQNNHLYKEVQIIDSTGEIKTLTPKDIKAFGYTEKEKVYTYVAKLTDENTVYFLQPVIIGQKTSLYVYSQENNSSIHEYYTFDKPDGASLFMTNYAALDTFKDKLKIFYKEYLEVQKLIDTKFNARRHIQSDIKEILEAINKL